MPLLFDLFLDVCHGFMHPAWLNNEPRQYAWAFVGTGMPRGVLHSWNMESQALSEGGVGYLYNI